MKTAKILNAICLSLILALAAGCDVNTGELESDAQEMREQALDRAAWQERIDRMEERIDRLTERAKARGDELGEEIEREFREIEIDEEKLEETWAELQARGESGWEQLKTDLETSAEKLNQKLGELEKRLQ